MNSFGLRNWKSIILLSLIVPTGLLATFRLTGILKEPSTLQEIMLDIMVWTFQRPPLNQHVDIGDTLEFTYSDHGFVALFYLQACDYIPATGSLSFDTLQIVLKINATTSISASFMDTIQIVVHKDQESIIEWQETDFNFKNLSLVDRIDGGLQETEAYIKLKRSNLADSIYAYAIIYWMLPSSTTQSHIVEISYDIVYYGGAVYNKIVQPFQLSLTRSE